ncbi:glycoside hydrolase family 13 protein [Rheinheimera sp.]|uniref:glycoside hydrolase family 13 protein n=1 Tax=Rheinheimera sp. TaxID=1869214 RepID=UPI002617AFB1|nr:glycoside hydrolase family 13 protein [Rheinheimera sp.]MCA1931367.1 glycoside hydrolase family 13 protein [Rheinheimera sp.]
MTTIHHIKAVLLGLLVVAPSAYAAQIEHLEPAFWWAGMKESKLQLMVHARDIQQAKVQLNYPGVKLTGLQKVDNPNYLFVDLELSPDVKPGSFELVFTKNGKTMARHNYSLLARQPGSAQRQGFSQKDLIYLITPDRFVNGDSSNDQVKGLAEGLNRAAPGGRHGGDIAGMQQALPYLQQLGVTQIWPQPLTENNSPAYSYHGYAATDLYKIDPRFGTNGDYKNFVSEANKLGIGVIQDIVVNHIGSNHWWLKDLPEQSWLNYDASFHPTNHARTTVQDPYAAKVDAKAFVDGWFVESMPDLNQRHPLLATYLIQNSVWWVEYANLSGIREDTYSYADKDFLTAWSKRLLSEYPNFNIVGEEWSANPVVVSYWQKGKQNADGYQSFTPSMMDFPLYYALLSALTEEESWDKGWVKLYEALGNDVIYPNPTNLVLFEGNHDTARLFSLLNEDRDLYRMAIIYLLTAPRIPQLYYGTEILKQSPKQRDDGLVRSDFPGGWTGDAVNAFTGQGLSKAQLEALQLVKKLANYRKTTSVLQLGKMKHFSPAEGVYSYVRYQDNSQVWVFFNKNAEAKTVDLNRYSELMPAHARFKDVLTGQPIQTKGQLQLAGRSSVLLELQ